MFIKPKTVKTERTLVDKSGKINITQKDIDELNRGIVEACRNNMHTTLWTCPHCKTKSSENVMECPKCHYKILNMGDFILD